MEAIKFSQLEANETNLVTPQLSNSTANSLLLIAIGYSGLLITVGFVVLMAWLGGIPVVL